ncbi:YqaA family protein [Fulvivirga sedimenti]|uniref:VTT domain-containing protein n=1 Tax=Fulvivirga sedimenti TaxID=2879465 RepID=A0A9X1HXK2_9BACT|nr:VTT domain-containing protein [Fulvivirga sedimenti]MCA6078299.1 VTT domain-containing protein [Fulvivirga sedimenti]
MNRRSKFLLKNLLKGLFWLAVIVIIYELLQRYTEVDEFINYLGNWPILIYSVFILSEIIFGIIPPELFMIWSLNNGLFDSYVLNVMLLATISYLAGILGYHIGKYLLEFKWTQTFMQKNVRRYKNLLNKYGGFLIFVGAVTPVPFSAICMLMGGTQYPFSRFLLISLARFGRFAAYAWVIWQTNKPV